MPTRPPLTRQEHRLSPCSAGHGCSGRLPGIFGHGRRPRPLKVTAYGTPSPLDHPSERRLVAPPAVRAACPSRGRPKTGGRPSLTRRWAHGPQRRQRRGGGLGRPPQLWSAHGLACAGEGPAEGRSQAEAEPDGPSGANTAASASGGTSPASTRRWPGGWWWRPSWPGRSSVGCRGWCASTCGHIGPSAGAPGTARRTVWLRLVLNAAPRRPARL